jgi:uncharacterized protein
MTTLIEEKRDQIRLLCQHFQVKRLDLFGSAARGDFQIDISDLDFVVSFSVQEPSEYTRCYFGLARGLEDLFQRPIDLVTETSIRNPYFRQSVDEYRQLIYAN